MRPFPAIVHEMKAISAFPGWSQPEPTTGYSWFDAALAVGGIINDAILLHGGCLVEHPDRHVTFELAIPRSQHTRRTPLARLDWRSATGGHTNPRKGDPLWAGRRVSETHLHDFSLNWLEAEGRMRGTNLPIAREVETELSSFGEILTYVGRTFRITNMRIVNPPSWQYSIV